MLNENYEDYQMIKIPHKYLMFTCNYNHSLFKRREGVGITLTTTQL